MTKALLALTAFAVAISLSIFGFAGASRATLISTIESPDKTYLLHLKGKKSRPTVPLIEHSVYFDLYRNGKPIVWGRKLHSGGWFDPAFENLFGDHSWVNSSTLIFARRQGREGGRDI